MRSILIFASVMSAAACAHNVAQDKNTGDDGRAKGAKPIPLVNNEARTQGIVTYPGGDRVDWKVIELPAKAEGRLEFKLTWDVPRPGLRLAFDVFDAYYKPVAASEKPRGRDRRNVRSRDAAIDNARGKYFVRVFAERRGDAGRYKLVASLKPTIVDDGFDPLTIAVADPPPLADPPEEVEACTDDNFDIKKKQCKSYCPSPRSLAPRDWKPCSKICEPGEEDVTNPACWAKMECPVGKPDRNVRKCTPDKFPQCNWAAPDAGNPNCDSRTPVVARIQKNKVGNDGLEISVPAGQDQGVTSKWTGYVLSGMAGDTPLPNGAITIIRVDRANTWAVCKLTTDQIKANPRVKLVPPKR